jgi:cytochrome c peroxidase
MRFRLLTGVWTLLVIPALAVTVAARQGTAQTPPQTGSTSGAATVAPSRDRLFVIDSLPQRPIVPLAQMVMPVPAANPATDAKIALGRRLFFDQLVSVDRSVSCATCHNPDQAFTDGKAQAIGVQAKVGRRNSQTLVNRGFGRLHFWDGRAATLEAQVLMPIADANEMAMPLDDLVTRLAGNDSYAAAFQTVFERPVSSEDIGRALAAYVRTIRSGDSPYDKFVAGAADALSAEAQQGLTLFRGKARCGICHREPLFTDEQFYNTGVAVRDDVFVDDGRFAVSHNERERGAFKVPTLREVAKTAPYMHDGSLPTLEAVVDFYDAGGRPNRNLMPLIKPLGLTADEKKALIAFLQSLSGVVSGK